MATDDFTHPSKSLFWEVERGDRSRGQRARRSPSTSATVSVIDDLACGRHEGIRPQSPHSLRCRASERPLRVWFCSASSGNLSLASLPKPAHLRARRASMFFNSKPSCPRHTSANFRFSVLTGDGSCGDGTADRGAQSFAKSPQQVGQQWNHDANPFMRARENIEFFQGA